MTEKSYGGNNGVREHLGKTPVDKNLKTELKERKSKIKKQDKIDKSTDFDDYIKAGEIAKQIRIYARSIIKKDMLLLDIAKQIEAKIISLGGEVAFPVNLSLNEIAAHYHPTIEDKTTANGILKVDFGVHINGFIADTAFSLDLTDDKKYSGLIKASEDALDSALSKLEKNPGLTLNDIGASIQEAIEKHKFSPIVNLSGHGLGSYNIHERVTIPNYANNSNTILEDGAYAIEPFATAGVGRIIDGPPSNIFSIINYKNPRSPTARKILEYVGEKYRTLPFSLREMQEKFGPLSRLGIKELIDQKIIHSYPQLIEKTHSPVSQAEHTIIKFNNKIIITTK